MKRKVLAIITIVLLLMTLIPTTAFATQYDYNNTYKLKSYSNSGKLIIGGKYSTAVYFNISLNGSNSVITHAFCGDIATSTQAGMLYNVYTLSDAKSRLNDFGNVGKIRSVINKALPGGSISVSNLVSGVKATTGTTINLTKDQAIWATQAAIWYLADNKAFTGVKNAGPNSDNHINTMAVYNYLISLPVSSGVNSVTKPTVSIDKSA